MADAVAVQTVIDGAKNTVVKLTNVSDGTGESAVLKVDVSTLLGAPSKVAIDKVQYDTAGMAVHLLWDATTDVSALILNGQGCMDFSEFGGLINNAGAGVTGDILLTTVGHTAGDTYTVILHLKK